MRKPLVLAAALAFLCFIVSASAMVRAASPAPATRPAAPAAAPTTAGTAGDAKLVVDGVFSVTAPQGYAWQTAQAFDPARGGGMYLAVAEGAPSRLVIAADARKLEKDPQRVAALKAHFNAMAQTVQKMGMKDLKFEQPKLDGAIPERVDYWISGVAQDGERKYFYAQTIFGQRTYQVQAASASEEDAKKLIASAKSLQEAK